MSNEIMIQLNELPAMAATMSKSGMFGKSPDQMLALMYIAHAEGLHPAMAAMEYDIIQGRPALKGQAALARFQQAGGSVKWLVRTDQEATAIFSHPKGGELKVSWTMEKAHRMDLDGKDNWKKQPGVMLSWRTVAEGVRAVFPACLNRMYLAEEVQDFEPMRNVSPETSPEDFVKIAAPNSAPTTEQEGPAVDWIALAAELTEKHGIDPKMKAAIWKECGGTAEAYCKQVEAMAAPAHPEPEAEGDGFQLTNDPTIPEMLAILEEYDSVEGLPAAAKKDIADELAKRSHDGKTLAALIEKVKSALN